jgi:hypothetical protein
MDEQQGYYEAVIADLEAKKAMIDSTIAGLRQLMNPVSGGLGTCTVTESDGSVPDDFFFGMSVADATKKYLAAVKKPKSTREITDALEKGGLTHASKDFIKTVSTILNQKNREENDEIVKVKDKWGLLGWYKGMKKKNREDQEGDVTTEADEAKLKKEDIFS